MPGPARAPGVSSADAGGTPAAPPAAGTGEPAAAAAGRSAPTAAATAAEAEGHDRRPAFGEEEYVVAAAQVFVRDRPSLSGAKVTNHECIARTDACGSLLMQMWLHASQHAVFECYMSRYSSSSMHFSRCETPSSSL